MKINLEKDEKVEIEVDDSVIFEVWGERNNEGTLILKHEVKR